MQDYQIIGLVASVITVSGAIYGAVKLCCKWLSSRVAGGFLKEQCVEYTLSLLDSRDVSAVDFSSIKNRRLRDVEIVKGIDSSIAKNNIKKAVTLLDQLSYPVTRDRKIIDIVCHLYDLGRTVEAKSLYHNIHFDKYKQQALLFFREND